MRFEWDEVKRRSNIRKHGLDFADAPQVFNGPMLVRPDVRAEYGEDRWIAMGLLRGRVVVLAFTERNGDTIRVISFRKANRYEREEFESSLQN